MALWITRPSEQAGLEPNTIQMVLSIQVLKCYEETGRGKNRHDLAIPEF